MSAYLTFTIIGRRSQVRDGTDEVQVTVKALARPDTETANWILRERYPSAEVTDIIVNCAHEYAPVTAASLATTPVRRHHARRKP